MTGNEKKKEQRREAMRSRDALPEAERAKKSAQICARLTEYVLARDVGVIMSYMPYGSEVDVTEFNREMLRLGLLLAFPQCHGAGEMDAAIPLGEDAWDVGAYGILTPRAAASRIVGPEEVDFIVVPCVGFGEDRSRTGHGAGYYDRYIPRSRAHAAAVAFEAQKLRDMAVDPWDVPLDAVITEAGIYG